MRSQTSSTTRLAVASIRQGWLRRGQAAYPEATEVFITRNGKGRHGERLHRFKVALQKMADETGLAITAPSHPTLATRTKLSGGGFASTGGDDH